MDRPQRREQTPEPGDQRQQQDPVKRVSRMDQVRRRERILSEVDRQCQCRRCTNKIQKGCQQKVHGLFFRLFSRAHDDAGDCRDQRRRKGGQHHDQRRCRPESDGGKGRKPFGSTSGTGDQQSQSERCNSKPAGPRRHQERGKEQQDPAGKQFHLPPEHAVCSRGSQDKCQERTAGGEEHGGGIFAGLVPEDHQEGAKPEQKPGLVGKKSLLEIGVAFMDAPDGETGGCGVGHGSKIFLYSENTIASKTVNVAPDRKSSGRRPAFRQSWERVCSSVQPCSGATCGRKTADLPFFVTVMP